MPTYYYVSEKAIAYDDIPGKKIPDAFRKADDFTPKDNTITLYRTLDDAEKAEKKLGSKAEGYLIFSVTGPEAKLKPRKSKGLDCFTANAKDYKFVSVYGQHVNYQNYNINKDGSLNRFEGSSSESSSSSEYNVELEVSGTAAKNVAVSPVSPLLTDSATKKPKASSPKKPAADKSPATIPVVPMVTASPEPAQSWGMRLQTVWQRFSPSKMRRPQNEAAVPLLAPIAIQSRKPSLGARLKYGARAAGRATWRGIKKYGPAAAVVIAIGAVFYGSGGSAAFVAWMQSVGTPAWLASVLSYITPVAAGMVGYGLVVAGWAGLKAAGRATQAGYKIVADRVEVAQRQRALKRLPAEENAYRDAVEALGEVARVNEVDKKKCSYAVQTDSVVADVADPRNKSQAFTLALDGARKMKAAPNDAAKLQVKTVVYEKLDAIRKREALSVF